MALFDCFKRKQKTDKPKPDGSYTQEDSKKKDEPQTGPKENKRIAIIVGHTKSAQGAGTYKVNGKRFREYEWNKARAFEVKEYLDQNFMHVESKIFYRDGIGREGVARMVGKWKADVSLELHFNSNGYEKDAFGSEMLVLKRDDKSARAGFECIDMLSKAFNTRKRNRYSLRSGEELRGVKPLGTRDRGYKNLRLLQKRNIKTILLIEPFFGGTKTEESRQFIEEPLRYSELLGDFLGHL